MIFKPLTEPEEFQWIKARNGVLLCEDMQGIVAMKDGEIKAVAVMDHWTPDSCHLHLAMDSPLPFKHGFAEEVCRHVFERNERKRVFGFVPSGNERAYNLNVHLGAKEVAVIPFGLTDTQDYIVMEATRENCKWLEQEEAA